MIKKLEYCFIAVFLQLSGMQKQNMSLIFTYTQLRTLANHISM